MDGKDSDFYGGDGPSINQGQSPDSQKGESDEGDSQTYLVNKDVCPGMKVGDVLSGRIVGIHENEYECEYEEKGDEENEGEESESMAPVTPPSEGGGGGEAKSMYG